MVIRNTDGIIRTRPVSISEYGILSDAVEVIEDNGFDWEGGFIYDTIDGSVVSVNAPISGMATNNNVTVVANENQPTYRFYYPFDVKTTIQASTMGTRPADLLVDATRALDVVLQKNIEREFWTGGIASQLTAPIPNRYLAQTGSVNVTPGGSTTVGVKTKHGVALLERALGDATIGSKGVIHATRDVASVLENVSNKTGVLTTQLGNFVVAGSGYTGTGPGNTAVTEHLRWMYATGPVTVRVGKVNVVPEEVGQAIDISTNTIKYFVDRPAAITWATTKLYAVLVDLSLDLA